MSCAKNFQKFSLKKDKRVVLCRLVVSFLSTLHRKLRLREEDDDDNDDNNNNDDESDDDVYDEEQ